MTRVARRKPHSLVVDRFGVRFFSRTEQAMSETGERYIRKRRFLDGEVRLVFADPDGRQFVVDGDEKVYGAWLVPVDDADEPLIAAR